MAWASKMGLRFAKILALCALCSLVLFAALNFAGNAVLDFVAESTNYQSERDEQRIKSLQDYVNEHGLAASDWLLLSSWYKGQPLVLMEVYRDGKLLFNSAYLEEEGLFDKDLDANMYDWYTYYLVEFADGQAEVLVLGNDMVRLRMGAMVAEVLLCSLVFLLLFLRSVGKMASYIGTLNAEVQVLEGGNLQQAITVHGNDELGMLAQGLESMRKTLLAQRTSEELSLQANQALITGLSHDLRTPLTRLKLYSEILRAGRYEDVSQAQDYLDRIDENTDKIRALSDSLLEYSLGAAEATAKVEAVPLAEVFYDALSEMAGYLEQKGFVVDFAGDLPHCMLLVCEDSVGRLLDNLASNIEKYADSASPVAVGLHMDEGRVGLRFANAVKEGRQDGQESTNIGLANVRYLMGRMHGSVQIDDTDGVFTITLWFKRA